jgi:hypothetical protein
VPKPAIFRSRIFDGPSAMTSSSARKRLGLCGGAPSSPGAPGRGPGRAARPGVGISNLGYGQSGVPGQPLVRRTVSQVVAHVLPLTTSDVRTRLEPAAVAAVFIGAPADEQDGAAMAAAAFRLTPAATRVLKSLLAGRSLTETAAALGVARSRRMRTLTTSLRRLASAVTSVLNFS